MTCSGVSTCGSEASAPGIGSWVTNVEAVARPARAGRDDDDLGAVLAHVVRARGAAPVITSTFASFSSWTARQLSDARPLAEPGQLRDPAHDPADLGLGLDEVHAAEAALAEDDRALHPRRAGADDEDVAVARSRPARSAPGASRAGTPRPRSRSACSRCGCPHSAFEMQTLQPMHSRISP